MVLTRWKRIHEPLEVGHASDFGDTRASEEWRISDEDIEPRMLALEHLRELNFPVKRCEWRIGMPPLLQPAPVALGLATHDRVGVVTAHRLPISGLLAFEERCRHEIAEEPHISELKLRVVP